MSLLILDTDHVSLFLEGNSSVISKVAQTQVKDLAITIVTVQELFSGWTGKINDPKEAQNLVRLYTKFWRTVEFLKVVNVLNFDEAANTHYESLLKRHPTLNRKRINKDVRIAAIALSRSAIVVTRNHKDFSQIPTLKLEDWTID